MVGIIRCIKSNKHNNHIAPVTSPQNTLAEFSEAFVINKRVRITVPAGYIAVLYMDGKFICRVESCSEKPIFTVLDKSFKGNICLVAFISLREVSSVLWGFGNIQVLNQSNNQMYSVGANGFYSLQIHPKSVSDFVMNMIIGKPLTVETLKNKIQPEIKKIGSAVLSEILNRDNVSVFDAETYAGELEIQMNTILSENDFLKAQGLALTVFKVEKVFVNSDDLERIRNAVIRREDILPQSAE